MRDERQEQRAVEAVLVEFGGRHVRGRHHHDAELEQAGEQPAEDHGVGDVGDVELVEAEQPALLGDLAGREADGILALDLAVFELLAENPHTLVNIGHELVEVRTSLADDRVRLEKQVHQHGLAAADIAVDVEALDRVGAVAAGKQPAHRIDPPGRAMRANPLFQRLETQQQPLLGAVALELLGRHQVFVELAHRHRALLARASGSDANAGMPAMQFMV